MFQPIGNLLGKSIKKSGASRQIEAAIVVEEATNILSKIIGKEAANRVRIMHLKDKALTIACLSSVLSQEIKLHQQELVNKLNKKFGREIVEKIRFLT